MDFVRILTFVLFLSAITGLTYALLTQTIHKFKGRRLSKTLGATAPQYFKRYRATP